MIAAVRADDLVHVGVAAFETAVHDADRLAPQDRPAAVAGLAGGRGRHDGLGHHAQPRITAITRARCRDRGRTATGHDVRIARTAHSTHRQEGVPGRYRGLEQRRCLSPDVSTRAVRGHPSRVPAVPVHRVLRHCWLAVLPRGEWRHHRRLPRAYHCARMRVQICVLPRTRRGSIGALSRREAASCPRVRPVSSTSGTARPRCSIRPASCGRAQRPRRPRQVAVSRGGPVGSGRRS